MHFLFIFKLCCKMDLEIYMRSECSGETLLFAHIKRKVEIIKMKDLASKNVCMWAVELLYTTATFMIITLNYSK